MRIRLRYDKRGKVRFLGHRDVARIWERVLRRAELPVAYTEGFSPRPRLSFGLALSTGYESDAEYLDIDLDDERVAGIDVPALAARLDPLLPVGLGATGAVPVPPGADSLQEAVTSCSWRLEVVGAPATAVAEAVAVAVAADRLDVTRSRKGKEGVDDIRPAVLALEVLQPTAEGALLTAELGVHPRSVRPAELVTALGGGLREGLVTRTHQWISRSGARLEPLDAVAPPDATQRPHAEARAS